MAERLKRAAAWLGLVTDDRYGEYHDADDDNELTESIGRDQLVGSGAPLQSSSALSADPGHSGSGHASPARYSSPSPAPSHPRPSGSHAANVTPLETKRAAPAAAPQHPTPTTSRAADLSSNVSSNSSHHSSPMLSRIVTVHPRTYNEARTIGEHFRDGVPVIMNLSQMEDADAKRLVDFAAGLIFGRHGTIERVTSKVFLLSPQNVNVTAEDKERIAGGFFNQS
ncbi:MAG TPA: cell division protein SepF [Propionibacteriaceae bacterium]|nr:cell division protein SepF [Propionibacteriaceae bacterium]